MTKLTIILSFLYSLQVFAASQCYYPNGEEADDYPCDPDAKDSACCGGGLGSVCMSNKLCLGSNGNTVRGSCTDENWSSTGCASFCLGADTGGTDLISCSNVTNTDTSYCCDHNANCCNSGVGRFNVLPSEPEVWATWNRQSTRYMVVGTMYDGKPKSTSEAATTTETSTSLTADATTTITNDPSTEESSVPTSTETPAGLSTAAQAGIGVGAGIGAIIIAAVVYLIWRKRKNSRAEKENAQLPYGGYGSQQMNEAWKSPYQVPKEPQELPGHTVRAELPAYH